MSNEAKLAQYQLWRTGADLRTLDEIGLTSQDIGRAINGVLSELAALRQQNEKLVDALENTDYAIVPRKPSTETLWAIVERKPQTVREIIEMFIELEGK